MHRICSLTAAVFATLCASDLSRADLIVTSKFNPNTAIFSSNANYDSMASVKVQRPI
jgi:hypothetical protein